MILLPSSVSFYDSRFSTSIATNTTLNAMSMVERIHQNTKEISIQEKNATKKGYFSSKFVLGIV